jgi:hypothetical protein
MDISGLSDSGLMALAQSMNANRLQEKISTSVMAMAQKQTEQDGQNALQLIASASPTGSQGMHFDAWA